MLQLLASTMPRRLLEVQQTDPYAQTVNGLSGGAPLAYWRRLNTATSITDTKGTRHATVTGAAANVAGLPQNSDDGIDFGGVATAEVPHDAGLALSTFSLSFWFRVPTLPTETTVWHILSKEQTGAFTGDFYVRIDGGGGLTINFQELTVSHVINSIIGSETAYHLCVRADGTGFDAFLNAGYLGKNTAFTGGWSANANPLQFAAAPFSVEPADVILDEVALFGRVITQAEVQVLAQRQQAPIAVEDVAVVPESAVTAINVLGNDTFVGTPTLQVMSQPAGGDSAAVSGTQINYTAGAVSSDTVRSFTYRLTDANGTSNTATVSVTVQESTFVPVSNANPFIIKPNSDPSVTVVSSMAALETAVNSAAPGDQIAIAAGSYAGGTRTFNRTGTAANPIVIRPQGARGTVTITGADWTMANSTSRLVIHNLFFDNNSRVIMNGNHNRISRCRWRNVAGRRCVGFFTSRDGRVDHCDFSQATDGALDQILSWDPNGFDNGTNVRNLVDYCYFHDLNQTVDLGNGQEPLRTYAQPDNISLAPPGSIVTVDHCLFTNMAYKGESEVCSMKSGGWKFSFCTFDDIDFYLAFRTSDNSEVRSCWFELMKSPCFNIFGANHLVIGNRFMGGLNVRIGAGDATSAQVASGAVGVGAYPRSTNCQIIGNRMGSGHLVVGGYWGVPPAEPPTVPALNNNLFANTRPDDGGDAHSFDSGTLAGGGARHSGTTFNNPGGASIYDYVPAVKLLVSQVGLSAADPLCPEGPQS